MGFLSVHSEPSCPAVCEKWATNLEGGELMEVRGKQSGAANALHEML